MRKFISISNTDPGFEAKLLAFASQREVACVLRSNRDVFPTTDSYSNFEWCVATDAVEEMKVFTSAFNSLKNFHDEKRDWLFGFLTYDLKNEIEKLESENHDGLKFPAVHFFQPKYIFLKQENELRLGYLDGPGIETTIHELMTAIEETETENVYPDTDVEINSRVIKEDYLKNVSAIKKHIQRGDIYEMNYCVEFYADNASIEPENIYEKLTTISPMPFSCYYKIDDQYLVCASPERFMAKRGKKIISQPIKGTARRGRSKEEDELIIHAMKNDEKEKSENVMIVDLVRNDLSRTAANGSVVVEELFGIYSFKQLHQMISTVVAEMRDDLHWSDVLRNAFPMGSMTGAPKIRAMELIEEFESTKRGLYSGAVGYITPEGDFDFNVVIRSILFNEAEKYLSFMVGSAITINSDPGKEYEECLLKAKAMMQVLKKELHEKVS
ncbi:MAG: anthranilate synthase component I family protein [Bacteroidota bacterium]